MNRKEPLEQKSPIKKAILWIIFILYCGTATMLNIPVFEDVANNIPIGGFILAPLMGLIEAVLAHYIGYCFARGQRGQRQKGMLLMIVALLFLIFIFIGQISAGNHPFIASSFIALLFVLSVTFSFSYYQDEARFLPRRMIDRLTKELVKMRGRLVMMKKKLAREKEGLRINAENRVNTRIQTLETNIQNYDKSLEHIQIVREDELKSLQNAKQVIIAAIKRIYSDTDDNN